MANTMIQGSVPLSGANTGTTANISATIGTNAFTGRCVYLTGFTYQSSGATAGTIVTITAEYAPTGNGAFVILGTWVYMVGTGATTVQVPLDINLIPPMQSGAPITGVTNATTSTPTGSISIVASGAGAGATFAGLNIWGFAL